MLGHEITFSMDSRGAIHGNPTEGVKPSRAAKHIMKAIKSTDIFINIIAKNTNYTDIGTYFVGGGFGGNVYNEDGSVIATQYVNPSVLSKMSTAYGKPGQDMIHEITEAYEGGKISQRNRMGVGIAAEEDERSMDIYNIAHNRAVPQSGKIWEILYDRHDNVVYIPRSAVRAEYLIRPKGHKKYIFHSHP